MNQKLSFPKSKIKVLVLENIHQKAIEIFQTELYEITFFQKALSENELIEKIEDIHILCIRSKTEVNEKVIQNAKKLLCIGAFCIGTNQIDLTASAKKGIAVFNAPYSNTRSVVEMALGQIIMLKRNIFEKNKFLHQGIWDKTAIHSHEVRGKVLGIVGYGNIGSQLSVLAEALGMKVYFYDLIDKLALGNATKCDYLDDLLAVSDIVTLHIDGRESNQMFFGENEFKKMKAQAIFLNLSRGSVVDLDALKIALDSEHIWAAAIDVFSYEPKGNNELFEHPLCNMPRVILTPHIGGSTEEAQANIGTFVPHKLLNYINNGDSLNAVNFPEVQLPAIEKVHRLLHIHQNVPGILAEINQVFAKYEVNIVAQYLKTNEQIGYVITDIAYHYHQEILNELKNIKHTIKFRILY